MPQKNWIRFLLPPYQFTTNSVTETMPICSLTALEVRSLKSRCWQRCVPSGAFRGRSVFLPFSASRDLVHSSALGPSFFCLQRATLHPLPPLSCLLLLALMALLSPSYKDPHGYIRPAPVVQDNLLIASLVAQMVKDLPAMQGDPGSIPGLGSSSGEGNDNPSSSMDKGAWWATVHGVKKSWTRLSN